MDKPKREAILDLAKYTNERIRVKFTGGREGLSGNLHSRHQLSHMCL
jgi:U6 snRNA-associated Sm-like protein LSm7